MGQTMKRRQLLKVAGGASVGVIGASSPALAGDTDPRPEPVSGEEPSENVPKTLVSALPWSNGEVPQGNWIKHSNAWCAPPDFTCDDLKHFLDNTRQVYTVGDEKLVFDSADDWTFVDDFPCPHDDPACVAVVTYTLPPKPPGSSYLATWEGTETGGDFQKTPFYFENEIRVVKDNGKSK